RQRADRLEHGGCWRLGRSGHSRPPRDRGERHGGEHQAQRPDSQGYPAHSGPPLRRNPRILVYYAWKSRTVSAGGKLVDETLRQRAALWRELRHGGAGVRTQLAPRVSKIANLADLRERLRVVIEHCRGQDLARSRGADPR